MSFIYQNRCWHFVDLDFLLLRISHWQIRRLILCPAATTMHKIGKLASDLHFHGGGIVHAAEID